MHTPTRTHVALASKTVGVDSINMDQQGEVVFVSNLGDKATQLEGSYYAILCMLLWRQSTSCNVELAHLRSPNAIV
eukprot:scaffold287506_cov39-Prasinocladus_malaysianus.AAC.1